MKIILAFFFLISWDSMVAQKFSDSIRIVREALQMIDFPEPIFDSPCVPEDYRISLQAIKQPLLVLAGSNDEAFLAEEYPKVIQAYSSGECFIVEGETHNGIRHNEAAMTKVREWAFNNKLR